MSSRPHRTQAHGDKAPARRARNSLSRDEIVAAALELVSAGGLEAATIRAVAARLHASPMSIYNHIEDRDDLLLAMLEKMAESLPTDVRGADPRDRIRERYQRTHDVLAEHIWAVRVLIRGTMLPVGSFALNDASIGDMLEHGLSPAEALQAHSVCWHLLVGEILDRHQDDLGPRPTQRERAVLAMDRSQFPSFAYVLDHLDPLDGLPPCQFPAALDVLLGGLMR